MRVDIIIKVEAVCKDNQANKVISTIIEDAKTGEVGDGMIFVSTIDDAINGKNW